MRYYRFGPFTLDAVARKLTIYGNDVAIGRKPLAILEQLLAAEGAIVTRDQLMRDVWPEEPVGETTLCQHIYTLRDALRMYVPNEEFVVTVHKTGYRMALQPQYPGQPAGAQASSLYLQGRFHLERRTEDGFLRAIACFERVLASEPGDAAATAGIGEALTLLGTYALRRPHETFPRARALLEQSLERDPNLSLAYCNLGDVVLHYDWDAVGASKMYGRALAIDPYSVLARTYRAWSYLATGQTHLALADVHAALAIQPNSPRLWTMLGVTHYFRGEYEAAKTHLQAAADIDASSILPRYYLCAVKGMMDDFDGVFEALRDDIPAEFRQHMWAIEGYAHGKTGNKRQMVRCVADICAVSQPNYPSQYNLAMIYAGAAEHGNAMAALNRGLQDNEPWMILAAAQPYFKALRANPEFVALVGRVGPSAARRERASQC